MNRDLARNDGAASQRLAFDEVIIEIGDDNERQQLNGCAVIFQSNR